MTPNLIAPCGLNCETCDARIATVNDDDELRAKTAAKWCQLNNTDAIKPEHMTRVQTGNAIGEKILSRAADRLFVLR